MCFWSNEDSKFTHSHYFALKRRHTAEVFLSTRASFFLPGLIEVLLRHTNSHYLFHTGLVLFPTWSWGKLCKFALWLHVVDHSGRSPKGKKFLLRTPMVTKMDDLYQQGRSLPLCFHGGPEMSSWRSGRSGFAVSEAQMRRCPFSYQVLTCCNCHFHSDDFTLLLLCMCVFF